MTDPSLSPADDERPAEPAPFRTIEHRPPGGGCGCGPTGCLTFFVVLAAVLLAAMVAIALFRPWVSVNLPRM